MATKAQIEEEKIQIFEIMIPRRRPLSAAGIAAMWTADREIDDLDLRQTIPLVNRRLRSMEKEGRVFRMQWPGEKDIRWDVNIEDRKAKWGARFADFEDRMRQQLKERNKQEERRNLQKQAYAEAASVVTDALMTLGLTLGEDIQVLDVGTLIVCVDPLVPEHLRTYSPRPCWRR